MIKQLLNCKIKNQYLRKVFCKENSALIRSKNRRGKRHKEKIYDVSYKFACFALGEVGIADMYLAIFADAGVMILAALNAICCLFVKKL